METAERPRGWGREGGRQKTTAAVLSRRRSAARSGTESGDGYRGSSAIIGAESSFFFLPFLFPLFFRRVILIWERQFVFAARAYLVTRRGDAAASAMHHGAARIEGYMSARREGERIAWRGRATEGRARGRTGGGTRDGPRERERERRSDRTVPRHSVVPLRRKAAPLHGPSSPDDAVSNPFHRFNEYNFLASPPLDPPLPAVGPRRSSRSPPPLIAAAATTITATNLLSSGTNAESRLPATLVPISRANNNIRLIFEI